MQDLVKKNRNNFLEVGFGHLTVGFAQFDLILRGENSNH